MIHIHTRFVIIVHLNNNNDDDDDDNKFSSDVERELPL